MADRILLHSVARIITESEVNLISGGKGGSLPSSGLTKGQPTKYVSSADPNGPMDEDTSAADW